MHGHQLRRDAHVDRAELWSQVKPGSLYGALHGLEGEGLIRPLRTERDGARPPRTVYEITEEGESEFRTLRDAAFAEFELKPDPVDLALAVSADLDREVLRGYIADRIAVLTARDLLFDHQLDRRWHDQSVADDLVVSHAKMRIQAELLWHREVLGRFDQLEARLA